MLNAEPFRISQEFELIEYIRAHSALAAVCVGMSTHQHGLRAAVENDIQFLTSEAYPDAWQAVAGALMAFGITSPFVLAAVGAHDEAHKEVVFRRDGARLAVYFPKAALKRLRGPELAGAIGHGLGHFLLGHDADPDLAALLALARVEFVADGGWEGELWDNPASADLLRSAAVLAHLQDLSADRVGLLATGNVEAVLSASMRGFIDVEIDFGWTREAAYYAVPIDAWDEPVIRPHPGPLSRALLLELFAASAPYRQAAGLDGGFSAAELAQRAGPFLPGLNAIHKRTQVCLDDSLLELILMDSLITAGWRQRPAAARMISRYLPPGAYEQVLEHYDALSLDNDLAFNPLKPWLRRAARKPPLWKLTMVERFLYLDSLDYRLDDQALGEVATLANAMGARDECRLVYTVAFGYDPFRWVGSERDPALWQRKAQAILLR